MNVILFGATGMVGQGVLRECLHDKNVEAVIAIGRKPFGQTHSKLRELIRNDLFDVSAVRIELQGYDLVFSASECRWLA
jgi:putative NADH-flavin reductase